MIDIIIPMDYRLAGAAIATVDSIRVCTASPHRIIAAAFGGLEKDLAKLRDNLKGDDLLIHGESLHDVVAAASGAVTNNLVAFITPATILRDGRWIGKMQQVINNAPAVGLVGTTAMAHNSSRPPFQLQHKLSYPFGPINVCTKQSLKLHQPQGKWRNWAEEFCSNCVARGAKIWVTPGVIHNQIA